MPIAQPGAGQGPGVTQRAALPSPPTCRTLLPSADGFPHRLGPLYASARLLWLLLGLAVAGLLAHFLLPPSRPWVLVWPFWLLGAQSEATAAPV